MHYSIRVVELLAYLALVEGNDMNAEELLIVIGDREDFLPSSHEFIYLG